MIQASQMGSGTCNPNFFRCLLNRKIFRDTIEEEYEIFLDIKWLLVPIKHNENH